MAVLVFEDVDNEIGVMRRRLRESLNDVIAEEGVLREYRGVRSVVDVVDSEDKNEEVLVTGFGGGTGSDKDSSKRSNLRFLVSRA